MCLMPSMEPPAQQPSPYDGPETDAFFYDVLVELVARREDWPAIPAPCEDRPRELNR
jgi:hypothetical protein